MEVGVRILELKNLSADGGEARTPNANLKELSCRLNTRNFKISWCGGFRTG